MQYDSWYDSIPEGLGQDDVLVFTGFSVNARRLIRILRSRHCRKGAQIFLLFQRWSFIGEAIGGADGGDIPNQTDGGQDDGHDDDGEDHDDDGEDRDDGGQEMQNAERMRALEKMYRAILGDAKVFALKYSPRQALGNAQFHMKSCTTVRSDDTLTFTQFSNNITARYDMAHRETFFTGIPEGLDEFYERLEQFLLVTREDRRLKSVGWNGIVNGVAGVTRLQQVLGRLRQVSVEKLENGSHPPDTRLFSSSPRENMLPFVKTALGNASDRGDLLYHVRSHGNLGSYGGRSQLVIHSTFISTNLHNRTCIDLVSPFCITPYELQHTDVLQSYPKSEDMQFYENWACRRQPERRNGEIEQTIAWMALFTSNLTRPSWGAGQNWEMLTLALMPLSVVQADRDLCIAPSVVDHVNSFLEVGENERLLPLVCGQGQLQLENRGEAERAVPPVRMPGAMQPLEYRGTALADGAQRDTWALFLHNLSELNDMFANRRIVAVQGAEALLRHVASGSQYMVFVLYYFIFEVLGGLHPPHLRERSQVRASFLAATEALHGSPLKGARSARLQLVLDVLVDIYMRWATAFEFFDDRIVPMRPRVRQNTLVSWQNVPRGVAVTLDPISIQCRSTTTPYDSLSFLMQNLASTTEVWWRCPVNPSHTFYLGVVRMMIHFNPSCPICARGGEIRRIVEALGDIRKQGEDIRMVTVEMPLYRRGSGVSNDDDQGESESCSAMELDGKRAADKLRELRQRKKQLVDTLSRAKTKKRRQNLEEEKKELDEEEKKLTRIVSKIRSKPSLYYDIFFMYRFQDKDGAWHDEMAAIEYDDPSHFRGPTQEFAVQRLLDPPLARGTARQARAEATVHPRAREGLQEQGTNTKPEKVRPDTAKNALSSMFGIHLARFISKNSRANASARLEVLLLDFLRRIRGRAVTPGRDSEEQTIEPPYNIGPPEAFDESFRAHLMDRYERMTPQIHPWDLLTHESIGPAPRGPGRRAPSNVDNGDEDDDEDDDAPLVIDGRVLDEMLSMMSTRRVRMRAQPDSGVEETKGGPDDADSESPDESFDGESSDGESSDEEPEEPEIPPRSRLPRGTPAMPVSVMYRVDEAKNVSVNDMLRAGKMSHGNIREGLMVDKCDQVTPLSIAEWCNLLMRYYHSTDCSPASMERYSFLWNNVNDGEPEYKKLVGRPVLMQDKPVALVLTRVEQVAGAYATEARRFDDVYGHGTVYTEDRQTALDLGKELEAGENLAVRIRNPPGENDDLEPVPLPPAFRPQAPPPVARASRRRFLVVEEPFAKGSILQIKSDRDRTGLDFEFKNYSKTAQFKLKRYDTWGGSPHMVLIVDGKEVWAESMYWRSFELVAQ